ncbi:DUF5431 family protein [Leclercia adecarboxylata]|uniref:DUF5431 family protein n=1 Tax=Leclercia adecarboxylata TaxID=83655 RepID=UPI002E10E2E2
MRTDSVSHTAGIHLPDEEIALRNPPEGRKTGGRCRTCLRIQCATRSREIIYIESHGVSHIHHCPNQSGRGTRYSANGSLRIVRHW